MKVDVKAAALAAGVFWAATIFVVGLIAGQSGYLSGLVEGISTLYLGYAATLTGSIIGAIWAFADAFIGVAILVWLYNKFLPKKKRK